MKYTKSIIGEIGYIDTNYKLNYKEAIKLIPKDARIMKAWEYLKLIDEDFDSLRNIPKPNYYFTYATDKYYRACRLSDFGDDSWFYAVGRSVDDSYDSLRGVLVVKKVKG